eukprot:4992880-Amphidinium_carterae.1
MMCRLHNGASEAQANQHGKHTNEHLTCAGSLPSISLVIGELCACSVSNQPPLPLTVETGGAARPPWL